MGRRMIWIRIIPTVQAYGGQWWRILKTPKKNWSCWTIRNGSPEVIQEYRRETQRMRQEADSLQQEIKTLEETEEAIKALPVRKAEGRAADVLYGPPMPKRK